MIERAGKTAKATIRNYRNPQIMLKNLLLLPLLILGASLAQATTVYKCTNADGDAVFTDKPCKGGLKMDVEPIPTIPAFHAPHQTNTPTKPPAKNFHYNKVIIMEPKDDKYFVNDDKPITVQVATSPGLRPSDKIQLMLNGAAHGKPKSSTTFKISSSVRGTYKISANVIDQDGKTIGTSNTVTIFVKRHSILIHPKK